MEINKGRFVFEGEQVAIEGEDNVVMNLYAPVVISSIKRNTKSKREVTLNPESVIKSQRFPNLQ